MPEQEKLEARIDPAVSALVDEAKRRHKTKAQLTKADRDAERVRVRLDVPQWLKDVLGRAAAQQDTSMNQIGAFLLAYAISLYAGQDAALLEALDNAKTTIRSMTHEHGFDLSDLAEILTDSAEGPS